MKKTIIATIAALCATTVSATSSHMIKGTTWCKTYVTWLGRNKKLGECAEATKAKGGKFFAFGWGRDQGQCYKVHTNSSGCVEGFKRAPYNFYGVGPMPYRPKTHMVKADVQCTGWSGGARGIFLGTYNSAEQCARASFEKGAKFFIFGKGNAKGRCYPQFTRTQMCTENFIRNKEYNFYGYGPKVWENKKGLEGLSLWGYSKGGDRDWHYIDGIKLKKKGFNNHKKQKITSFVYVVNWRVKGSSGKRKAEVRIKVRNKDSFPLWTRNVCETTSNKKERCVYTMPQSDVAKLKVGDTMWFEYRTSYGRQYIQSEGSYAAVTGRYMSKSEYKKSVEDQNAKITGAVMIKKNFICQAERVELRRYHNAEQCAFAVKKKGGEFFVFFQGGKRQGICAVVHTQTAKCSQGLKFFNNCNFYKVAA